MSTLTVAADPVLSVVVPLFNEEEVIVASHQELTRELVALGLTYELIFVNDGSRDRSLTLLEQIAGQDPRVRVVSLSRNFGHELATTAGLHHARGEAAIVIDADLQDPPALMRVFVDHWRQGYQVVYGVREQRQGETLFKKLSSFAFYRLVAAIADVSVPRDTGDFRLMDRKVVDVFCQLKEDPRFFRGLVSWIGFRQLGVPFVRQPRAAGYSKYKFHRLFRLALDTITAFSTFPALAIMLTACALMLISMIGSGVTVALWAAGRLTLPTWGWAGLGFLGLWNLQFFALAMLGEYLVRTHRHTQQRPLFIVDRLIESQRPTP